MSAAVYRYSFPALRALHCRRKEKLKQLKDLLFVVCLRLSYFEPNTIPDVKLKPIYYVNKL